MNPREAWFRYQYARRGLAGLLQEAFAHGEADWEVLVTAMELVGLWKMVVANPGMAVTPATMGEMIEMTEDWRMMDGGEGQNEGVLFP